MEDIRINEENYSKDFQSAQKKEKQSENEKLSKLN